MTLHGAAEFRSRLNAIRRTGVEVASDWAEEDVRRVRGEIPKRTGATAASVHAEVDSRGARVLGSPVITFLAGGTRAHPEEARGRAMRFQIGGRTIFSPRVAHPPTAGNPAILQAARDALGGFAAACYRLWNGAA